MDYLNIKILPVSFITLMDYAKKKVKDSYIEDAKKLSQDPKFLLDVLVHVPSGEELNKKSQEWLQTFEGVTSIISFGIQEHNKDITKEKLEEFFDKAFEDKDMIGKIFSIIFGTENVEDKKK